MHVLYFLCSYILNNVACSMSFANMQTKHFSLIFSNVCMLMCTVAATAGKKNQMFKYLQDFLFPTVQEFMIKESAFSICED